MCYILCSSCVICADNVSNMNIFSLYLVAWRRRFCGEPKHVAKYSSTSYTNIVAINGSSVINIELDSLIVN